MRQVVGERSHPPVFPHWRPTSAPCIFCFGFCTPCSAFSTPSEDVPQLVNTAGCGLSRSLSAAHAQPAQRGDHRASRPRQTDDAALPQQACTIQPASENRPKAERNTNNKGKARQGDSCTGPRHKGQLPQTLLTDTVPHAKRGWRLSSVLQLCMLLDPVPHTYL